MIDTESIMNAEPVEEIADETKDAHIHTLAGHCQPMVNALRTLSKCQLTNDQTKKVVAIRDNLGEAFQQFVDSLN